MLSPKPIRDLDYYIELGKEDYYIEGGEPAGEWSGIGARALGVNGQVSNEQFLNIMQGFHPRTGKPLCRNAGSNHYHGTDLVFNADKSVSVLWARATPELRQQIQQAHDEAVLTANRFIERHAGFTRTGAGGKNIESVAGLVFTNFQHSTSRTMDMHLHTHSLLANLALRQDGQWRTGYHRRIFTWQKSIGSIYRAELAERLLQLGFELEADKNQQYQIVGVPESVKKHFSKRTAQIQIELDKIGIKTSASKIGDAIAKATRKQKMEIHRPELFNRWQNEMDQKGFTKEQAQSLQNPERKLVQRPLESAAILSRITDKTALFREQDLFRVTADLAPFAGLNVKAIESHVQLIKHREDLILLEEDHYQNKIFTLRALQLMEQDMVKAALRMHHKSDFMLSADVIDQAIKKLEQQKGFTLSDEQRAGVHAVSQSRLDILQGSAGSGKSTSMTAIKFAYEAEGYQVMGTCLSQQAVKNLEAETGIQSINTAKLFHELDEERTPLKANTVLVIDEAGQLGTRALNRLFAATEAAGCKVILTGEDKQLEAIEYGGALRFLSRDEVVGTTRITTILRQHEAWARQAVEQLRDGKAMPALEAFEQREMLNFCSHKNAAKEKLVSDALHYQQQNPDKHSVILAQRWTDVKDIGEQVRAHRQQQGFVGQENISVKCTAADKEFSFTFSKGDRIKFTQNNYRFGVHNGTLGTIKQIQQIDNDVQFHIKTDEGKLIKLNASEYANDNGHTHLSLAYALTLYSSQGMTVNGDVFIYYSSGMDRAHSYVGGSRAKDDTHWYFNNNELDGLREDLDKPATDKGRLATLAKLMSVEGKKANTLEYLDPHQLNELVQDMGQERMHKRQRDATLER